MGSCKQKAPLLSSSDDEEDCQIRELRERHRLDMETLTLTRRPLKTLQFFASATLLCFRRSLTYTLIKGVLLPLFTLTATMGFLLVTLDGPHKQHVHEFLSYLKFGLWWIGLGIASSIGLGAGLHTFVLYLGPHIAFFTIKATQCGRVDLKTALYDTIQLERGPSWLGKDCSEFGPPLYPSLPDSLVRVPLSAILPQVQIEAILWGIGTAIGELPPYFISRAAHLSGGQLDEEFGTASSKDDGPITSFLKRCKQCFLSQIQHLNFFTILILASVPNPLFDLAGIMCGQLGVPFWKFFLATLLGKAFIKTHIQTVFIIFLCNNQLLEFVEKEFFWILAHIPGLSPLLPTLVSKVHALRERYRSTTFHDSSRVKDKPSNMFNMAWNAVIWLMVTSLFSKVVTSTAQRHLKESQESEISNLSSSKDSRKKSKLKNHSSRRK